MTEPLPQHFTIDLSQKLYEKNTAHGMLAVYQTTPYGLILAMNGHILLSEQDGFLYHEMMVHPALFTHPHPVSVAIIGNYHGILQEVLKHPSVTEVHCINDDTELDEAVSHYFAAFIQEKSDARIYYHLVNPDNWLKDCKACKFDIIIQNQADSLPLSYQLFYLALRDNGMLIHPCYTSFLHLHTLKPLFQTIELAGFHDWQTLHFPQPSYPTGMRIAMLAMKEMSVKRIREKEVFNRQFTTRYYNFDTHKAALAIPQFMREE
jgi:spermidine synthase